MGTDIERREDPDRRLSPKAKERMRAGVSDNTRTSNATELRRYLKWCEGHGRTAVPATPETLAEFVSDLAEAALSPATIRRSMSVVRTAHRAAGAEPPDTEAANAVLKGYRRTEKPRARKAPPMVIPDLLALLGACDVSTLAGKRDRALIALGWSMMARRSELTALDVEDVAFTRRGLEVYVAASKTDKEAIGAVVRIPNGEHVATCPARLVKAWVEALGESSGPLFRPIDKHGALAGTPKYAGRGKSPRMTPKAAWAILERVRRQAGVTTHYSPHSLRSGGATAAYEAGAGELEIARHGRWQDGSKVLLGYIRPVDQWERNPMRGTGL